MGHSHRRGAVLGWPGASLEFYSRGASLEFYRHCFLDSYHRRGFHYPPMFPFTFSFVLGCRVCAGRFVNVNLLGLDTFLVTGV